MGLGGALRCPQDFVLRSGMLIDIETASLKEEFITLRSQEERTCHALRSHVGKQQWWGGGGGCEIKKQKKQEKAKAQSLGCSIYEEDWMNLGRQA